MTNIILAATMLVLLCTGSGGRVATATEMSSVHSLDSVPPSKAQDNLMVRDTLKQMREGVNQTSEVTGVVTTAPLRQARRPTFKSKRVLRRPIILLK